VFRENIDVFMKIFLDDFTIFSDLSTQLEKLKKWFFKCKEFGISLNLDKCAFMVLSVSQPHFGAKCENATHTPKSGKMESSRTSENSKLDLRGQISSHWSVLGVIGKVLKFKCSKWPRMSHLDICSPCYGQKKGRESNWQFDSRPLKVGNRPFLDVRF